MPARLSSSSGEALAGGCRDAQAERRARRTLDGREIGCRIAVGLRRGDIGSTRFGLPHGLSPARCPRARLQRFIPQTNAAASHCGATTGGLCIVFCFVGRTGVETNCVAEGERPAAFGCAKPPPATLPHRPLALKSQSFTRHLGVGQMLLQGDKKLISDNALFI